MSEDLPERPLTGEPLALDLVNTQWVESGQARDLLALPNGLETWLAEHGLDDTTDLEAQRSALQSARDAVRACLASDDSDPEARTALNRVLDHGRVTPQLTPEGSAEAVTVDRGWEAAWAAAHDYVRLRSAWPRWRVRACAHSECILYFLDTTRNGTRRWCDMRTCGNRAKARRYQRRHAR